MKSKLILYLLTLGVLLAFFHSADAQETAANINGRITDTEGEPLPGATIRAVHEPSGTDYGTTSRSDGRYNLRNLRVGGPYTVTVTFVGFREAQ